MRQLPFLDSDHEIERYLGCSIREFFDREGEAAFREVEERVIAETLGDPQQRVVATGGGSVLRPANRVAMMRACPVASVSAITRCSMSRNAASPSRSKYSRMEQPRKRSIS